MKKHQKKENAIIYLNVYGEGVLQMKKRRFFIRTGILLVMLAALCYTMYNSVFAKQDQIKEGSIAPNFVLQSVDGERIELKDLKGKGVFLNFWVHGAVHVSRNSLIWQISMKCSRIAVSKLLP